METIRRVTEPSVSNLFASMEYGLAKEFKSLRVYCQVRPGQGVEEGGGLVAGQAPEALWPLHQQRVGSP